MYVTRHLVVVLLKIKVLFFLSNVMHHYLLKQKCYTYCNGWLPFFIHFFYMLWLSSTSNGTSSLIQPGWLEVKGGLLDKKDFICKLSIKKRMSYLSSIFWLLIRKRIISSTFCAPDYVGHWKDLWHNWEPLWFLGTLSLQEKKAFWF